MHVVNDILINRSCVFSSTNNQRIYTKTKRTAVPTAGLYKVTGFSDSGVSSSILFTSHNKAISLKARTPPL